MIKLADTVQDCPRCAATGYEPNKLDKYGNPEERCYRCAGAGSILKWVAA